MQVLNIIDIKLLCWEFLMCKPTVGKHPSERSHVPALAAVTGKRRSSFSTRQFTLYFMLQFFILAFVI